MDLLHFPIQGPVVCEGLCKSCCIAGSVAYLQQLRVLDADESGEISLEEFVEGCMQLQGPAQSVQLARMRYENKITRQEVRKVLDEIKELGAVLMGC